MYKKWKISFLEWIIHITRKHGVRGRLTVNFLSGGHFLMHKSSFIVQLADFAFLLGVFWDAM